MLVAVRLNRGIEMMLKGKHFIPEIQFLVTFVLLFGLLYGFNIGFIGIVSPGGIYLSWLDRHFNYIQFWRATDIQITGYMLESLGYKVRISTYTLYVIGHSGFKLVYSCLGYGMMSFFLAFVIAFPKPRVSKLVFLCGGVMLIQCLNLIRFLLIALYWTKPLNDAILDHHLMFNAIIYLIITVKLYFWTKSKTPHALHHFKKGF